MHSNFRSHGPYNTAARRFLPVCVGRVGSTTFRIFSKYFPTNLLYCINIFQLFSVTANDSASNFIIYNLLSCLDRFLQIPPFEFLEKKKDDRLADRSYLRFLSERDHLFHKNNKISNLAIVKYRHGKNSITEIFLQNMWQRMKICSISY